MAAPVSQSASLLSRRARKALLTGRFAARGGGRPALRARNIAMIASSYTRDELAGEAGIGPVTLAEIESWLTTLGLTFRTSTNA